MQNQEAVLLPLAGKRKTMNNLNQLKTKVKLRCISLMVKDVIEEPVYTLDNCLALAQKLDTAVPKITNFQLRNIPLIRYYKNYE